MTLDPGIHAVPADRYHDDPCAEPSLSASIAHLLCSRSPLHAWAAHPRLNPDFARVERDIFDAGTVAHALLLDGTVACDVIDAPDWRTKEAKEAREAACANGLIVLLRHQWEQVEAMIEAARVQLVALDIDPPPLTDGAAEQTLVWEDHGVMCRARLDWLRDDWRIVEDLKTTSASANPRDWSRRRLWEIGADVQAAFYLRGLRTLTGADAEFRWVVIENTPPYALSVLSLAPSALELANDKVSWAIERWGQCIADDSWPAYASEVAYAEAPAWIETQWMEQVYLDREGGAA